MAHKGLSETLAAMNNSHDWERFFYASIKMVMTWGWFMALGFPHYHIFHTSQPHPFLGQLPMCVAALRTMSTQFLPAHL